jgi:hypothetical protein
MIYSKVCWRLQWREKKTLSTEDGKNRLIDQAKARDFIINAFKELGHS